MIWDGCGIGQALFLWDNGFSLTYSKTYSICAIRAFLFDKGAAAMKLTDRQKEVLSYISEYMDAWGRSPSFEEVCSHFGFSSYNTVSGYLNILEQKGYIRRPRGKNKKRAIRGDQPRGDPTI
jgi:hypothetical protein